MTDSAGATKEALPCPKRKECNLTLLIEGRRVYKYCTTCQKEFPK